MAEMGLSYQMIKTANQAREADELKSEQRRKDLLILMYHHLSEEGYVESAQTLSRETNIDLSKHEVCDNIDLSTILMEYESYYYVKFSRYPKVTKKPVNPTTVTATTERNSSGRGKTKKYFPLPPIPATSVVSSCVEIIRKNESSSMPSLPKIPQNQTPTNRPRSGHGPRSAQASTRKDSKTVMNGAPAPIENDNGLRGLSIQGNNSNNGVENGGPLQKPRNKFGQIIDCRAMINDATRLNVEDGVDPSDRLLKPLGGYVGYNSEWRELAQVISRDIYSEDPNVRWDDIIGLESAKRLVKESVVYPIKYPELFTGILSPWKGLLLYGPPGTGKTLLAKAVATECKTTFFNISASSIVSKWRGDSEKLVRVLFELARFHAPSTIFIDELESIMSQRGAGGSGGGEHEGSRRMKTELLVQMDGLAKTEDLVFLLAASNLPWELDHAMLRRLEKRIIVDLPTYEARKRMFLHHLPPIVKSKPGGLELVSEIDYDHVAKLTEGYSGSDIKVLSKEAAMRTVRKIFEALECHDGGEELHIQLDTIKTSDVEMALQTMKPSAQRLSTKYAAWSKEFESV